MLVDGAMSAAAVAVAVPTGVVSAAAATVVPILRGDRGPMRRRAARRVVAGVGARIRRILGKLALLMLLPLLPVQLLLLLLAPLALSGRRRLVIHALSAPLRLVLLWQCLGGSWPRKGCSGTMRPGPGHWAASDTRRRRRTGFRKEEEEEDDDEGEASLSSSQPRYSHAKDRPSTAGFLDPTNAATLAASSSRFTSHGFFFHLICKNRRTRHLSLG